MKKTAFLEYVFMFDPGMTWAHLHEFEGFLANALKEVGLEGEVVKPVGGQNGRGIVYIRKADNIVPLPSKTKGRPQTMKGRLSSMKDRKIRAPAKRFKAKKPERKLRGFDKVMRKAGGKRGNR